MHSKPPTKNHPLIPSILSNTSLTLTTFHPHPNTTHLTLQNCCSTMWSAIIHLLQTLKQLSSLRMQSCSLEDHHARSISSLSLERLYLGGNQLTEQACGELKRMEGLRGLDLGVGRHREREQQQGGEIGRGKGEEGNRVGDQGVQILAGSLTNLEELILICNGITDIGAMAITKNLQNLRILNLRGNFIGPTTVHQLECLKLLQQLDLSGSAEKLSLIGDEQLRICLGLPQLKSLSIRYSHITLRQLHPLPYPPHLSSLTLSNNPLFTPSSIPLALRLSLSSCDLTDESLYSLTRCLNSLVYLNISNNKITDEGFLIIARDLRKLKIQNFSMS